MFEKESGTGSCREYGRIGRGDEYEKSTAVYGVYYGDDEVLQSSSRSLGSG